MKIKMDILFGRYGKNELQACVRACVCESASVCECSNTSSCFILDFDLHVRVPRDLRCAERARVGHDVEARAGAQMGHAHAKKEKRKSEREERERRRET